jgi:hypothetical protein
VTLPEPELADGAVDACARLPLLPELLLLELLLLELLLLELPEVLAAEPELVEVVCCAPGSANATAPAAAMLTAPAVTVTARSRACPRSRSATVRLVAC